MRLNASAIQLNLQTDPGGFPIVGTEFPWAWTLQEYVDWYWRVKTWQVTVSIAGTGDYLGTPYSFSFAKSVPMTFHDPFSAIPDDERQGVKDAEFFDATTADPYEYEDTDEIPGNRLYCFNVDSYSSPSENSRGFWTGEQGGDAGLVIPRFRHIYGHAWADDDTAPSGILTGLTIALSTRATDFTNPVGPYPLAYTFNGKSTDLYMDGDALPYDATFSSVSITVEPDTYFEFSDGLTPLWHAATGVQLVDPLPHD